MRVPVLLSLLAGLAARAGEGSPGEPPAEIYARFPHEKHNAFFGTKNLGCTSCHGFGPDGRPAWEGHFRDNCHQCHVTGPSESGEPVTAVVSKPCTTCHAEVPAPFDHGAGWEQAHGAEARADVQACRACHKAAFCVDCHERKESLQYQVHDRTWLSVHGMAARTDPFACDDCHAKSTCENCHRAAGGRWP